MFDVFSNDFSAQHGVLALDMAQSTNLVHLSGIENMFLSDDVATSHILQVAGKEFSFKGALQDAKLMVSPDDEPPRPPRAHLIGNCPNLETDLPTPSSIMADPDGDPPIPSKLLQLTGNLFNFNSTLPAPKVMVSPDDQPPRPPR